MNPTDEAAIAGWPTEQEQADLREYEAEERDAGRDPWDDDDDPDWEHGHEGHGYWGADG